MSITSELKNPESAASLWLAKNFDLDPVISALAEQTEGAVTIKPRGNLKDYPWSTVGSAVEFRLRQRCGVYYYDTTASLGTSKSLVAFNRVLAVLWESHQEEQWTSNDSAWVMYFAGLCEGIFRSGNSDELMRYREVLDRIETSDDWANFRRDSRLYFTTTERDEVDANGYPCLKQLLMQMKVPEEVLTDIGRVSDAAMSSENFQVIRHPRLIIDSPIFGGSKWVGGADGDFIVGHTLYDVKTTVRPENLWRFAIRQLISYVALDAWDEYRIEELAIFLPRQHGAVARVALDAILGHSTFSSRGKMQESLRRALGQ